MADQYDNTDKGAAFKPFDTQSLILQGKINDEGNDIKVMLVKDITRDGKTIIEVYEKAGVLFTNDKKESEKHPDYTGPFRSRRLAAWKKVKDGAPYMTFNVSDQKQQTQDNSHGGYAGLPSDDVPF